jgi:hypothetical protein
MLLVPSIRGPAEKAYWWTAKRLFGSRRVGDLTFVYIDAEHDRPASEIEAVLTSALQLISLAKGGFGELVTSHLGLVAALKVAKPYACVSVQAYISPFRGHEASNSEYLACQLVWAATYIRLARNAAAHGRTPEIGPSRDAAFQAQLRFVQQFANGEEWFTYLQENHPESR